MATATEKARERFQKHATKSVTKALQAINTIGDAVHGYVPTQEEADQIITALNDATATLQDKLMVHERQTTFSFSSVKAAPAQPPRQTVQAAE